MASRHRIVRYGAPIAVVVLGVAWAAVDTNRVGNTAGTVLIAVGLIAFMALVGRDIGMGEKSARIPSVEDRERASHRADAPAASNGRSAEGSRRLQRDGSPPSSPS